MWLRAADALIMFVLPFGSVSGMAASLQVSCGDLDPNFAVAAFQLGHPFADRRSWPAEANLPRRLELPFPSNSPAGLNTITYGASQDLTYARSFLRGRCENGASDGTRSHKIIILSYFERAGDDADPNSWVAAKWSPIWTGLVERKVFRSDEYNLVSLTDHDGVDIVYRVFWRLTHATCVFSIGDEELPVGPAVAQGHVSGRHPMTTATITPRLVCHDVGDVRPIPATGLAENIQDVIIDVRAEARRASAW